MEARSRPRSRAYGPRAYRSWAIAFLLLLFWSPVPAAASQLPYLTIPGIEGPLAPPGPPGSLRLLSYDLNAGSLDVSKRIDDATGAIQNLAASGTVIPSMQIDVFETAISRTRPIRTLVFTNAVITSYSASNPPPEEDFSFSFESVEEVLSIRSYMTIDGITGSAPPPGPPGSIELLSLEVLTSSFQVSKELDSTSSVIQNLVASGTPIPSIRIDVFETDASGTHPLVALLFTDALISSYGVGGSGGATPIESMTILFQTLELLAPPSAVPVGGPGVWLVMLGLLVGIGVLLQRATGARRPLPHE